MTSRTVQEPLLAVSGETSPSFNPVLKSRKPNMSAESCRFLMIFVLSLGHGPKEYIRTSQDPRSKNDSSRLICLLSTTLATARNSQPLATSNLLNLCGGMNSYVSSRRFSSLSTYIRMKLVRMNLSRREGGRKLVGTLCLLIIAPCKEQTIIYI